MIRTLAARVAEIAAHPAQLETIALWKALNGLRPVRPMVMIDQLPWHELDADGELRPSISDPFWRDIEIGLRRTLYAWRHLRADMVVEPVLDIPRSIRVSGFGLEVREHTLQADIRSDIRSHAYIDQLATEADLDRIRPPVVVHDAESTDREESMARELVDGLLDVRMQGVLPHLDLWDDIVTLRGAETVLLDLVDRPAFVHELVRRLADARLAMLDELETRGLLGYGQRSIHCTGAYTDELPAPDFNPASPRARDLWTYGMAQILTTVSPAMFEEFEIRYAGAWYARFGLGYYGCCDPLDDRVDLIRRLPNIRKISMSPWADVDRGAESIGGDFVFSWKPSPALLAMDAWEPEAVTRIMRHTVQACARHGCSLEIILKDVSTVRQRPDRLWEWAALASQVAAE